MRSVVSLVLGSALVLGGGSVAAAEDTELWLNPRASTSVGTGWAVELETAQRLRQAPRDDTVFFRLWLHRDGPRGVTASAGAEHRFNGPVEEETRFLQQLSYGWGPISLRTRVEQRDVSTADQWGLRARQRIGTSIPLGQDETGWSLAADAEVFVTLRSTERGGDTGLTGLRTFVGFERPIGSAEVSLGYVRQQDIRPGPDRVGHAPFIGLSVDF